MRYLPHTDEEIGQMLGFTGHEHLEELFAHIPPACRFEGEIDIPGPLSEWALCDRFKALGARMQTDSARGVLLGAGSYQH